MWDRISTVYSDTSKYSLWGKNGIQVSDPTQGKLGNCWFVAAAAAIADVNPSLIEKMFLTEGLNTAGIYSL